MPKVLMVFTNTAEIGDTGLPTGYYVAEAAHSWPVFVREGFEVDLASPLGGEPPADGLDRSDPVKAAWMDDAEAQRKLADTLPLADVDAGDYDAVFYIGGRGPMWDLPDNPASAAIVRAIWEAGGVVAAVCHGPCALLNVTLSDGSYLIAGKPVTGFSETEEVRWAASIDLPVEQSVPFQLEPALRDRSGDYRRDDDWAAHIEIEGRLATGQNPASAGPLAEEVVKLVRAAQTAKTAA